MNSTQLTPHRGVVILVLGILSLLLCFVFGIAAWMMGNADLKQMDAGLMDPEGRGLTQAGKLCGIIGLKRQSGLQGRRPNSERICHL